MELVLSSRMDIVPALNSVRELARVRDSEQLERIINQVERRSSGKNESLDLTAEYDLIVDANNLSVNIDDDINIIHKYVKNKYSTRFPELDSLIPTALEYLMAVKELGNNLDNAKNNSNLQNFLTPATIMVVSVTASTTQGKYLSDDELLLINEACDIAIELNQFKIKIFEFVESRMYFIAPNVSSVVGANIAAKLMGLAGGLDNLAKMPACNVEVLGSKKKNLSGFSSLSVMPHTGFVFNSSLVQESPPDLRRKIARMVAYKCTIAARIDISQPSPNGEQGRILREKIEKMLDKLQEPPPVKQVKPLPAPIDVPKKKRGGKRVRRMKERMAMTEFRKQQNRMSFGEIEDDAYQDDLGFTTGQIGKSSMGRIRAPQIDEKTKVRISKALHKNLQKQQAFGGTNSFKKPVAGTASSVAFTPLQGLEIVNPQAAEGRSNEVNNAYFSGGFFKKL